MPVVLTNGSNNDGPLAVHREAAPLSGDGANVRDWLDMNDHADALLLAANQGQIGRSYDVGGSGSHGTASERSNWRQPGRHPLMT